MVRESNLQVISAKINCAGREDKDDAFFVADLSDVVRKYKLWVSQLPRVKPFYAVKCNDDMGVLTVLSKLGTGFDCASKAEIQKVLDLNVAPERIVYANPCKQLSHIKYAAKHDVSLMTFDNMDELYKVKSAYPSARLVIRILPPDDTKARCQFGMKYGAHPKDVPALLKTAKDLDLNVVGVSFHVGSDCYDAACFGAAVASARTVFDLGTKAGYNFDLLDIGGGFPGQESAKISFEEICRQLRPALDVYFPESMNVEIISEPGRFFVASAFTLATNIISKRCISKHNKGGKEEEEESFMYYINDGVYGSFNCLLYDHAEVEPTFLEEHEDANKYKSSVWGPTCDGLDQILKSYPMPEMQVGDWIIFKDMGAYTMCAASNFNGMPKPRCYYLAHEEEWVSHEAVTNKNATKSFKLRPRAVSTSSADKVPADVPAFQELLMKKEQICA